MSDTKTLTETLAGIEQVVSFMRQHGIKRLREGDLELELDSRGPVLASTETSVPESEPEKKKGPGKPGADGLFAWEQREAYGRVIDAEE